MDYTPEIETGEIINERYIIHERVGINWNSEYYHATQIDIAREVGIKILQSIHLENKQATDIFIKGINYMSQLEHQHIAPIYDVGHYLQRPYIVMRYLANGSIERILADQHHISIMEKIRILKEVADALDFAHSKGIVHGGLNIGKFLLTFGASLTEPQRVSKAHLG
jgi:serine/threonine protein kinase